MVYLDAFLQSAIIKQNRKVRKENFKLRVLILSCNTGEGHNAAGQAVKEQLEAMGHEAVLLDMMSFGKKYTSGLVGGGYVKTVTWMPGVFGMVYQAGELVRRIPFPSPVYYANARLAKPLKRYLEKESFDLLVTPHLYPAETFTYMKKKGWLKQKTVAIATDYTCIPFWEETDCDFYVIPHEDLADEFASYGIPREKLLPYGIPVRRAFTRPMSREGVRAHLNLPEDRKIFLVMSGSMGFGKIHVFAKELAKGNRNGEQIVIICGKNKHREHLLRFWFQRNPDVRVVGFTRHVAEYMAACDVIFTKPGGLSSTEAAVSQIPIIHTAPIPGCEEKNLEFFALRGMSVGARTRERQIAEGRRIICNDGAGERMRAAQKEYAKPEAVEKIVCLLEQLQEEEIG